MKSLIILLLGFLSLLIQSVFLNDLPSSNLRINLLYVLVLYVTVYEESFETGGFLTMLLGIMADALGSSFFGQTTVVYLFLYLLFRSIRRHVFIESRTSIFLAILIMSFLHEVCLIVQTIWINPAQIIDMSKVLFKIGNIAITTVVAYYTYIIVAQVSGREKLKGY